jgi:general secretion pathway protein D
LIEAAVVEITGDAGKAVGIQWGAVDEQNLVGGVNFTNVGKSLNDIILAATSDTPSSGLAGGLTLGGGAVNSEGRVEFAVILQALNNAANANLLSTPSLMTLDNEEAEIVVAQNVPFVTGSQLSSNNDNPFQTIERKDVGLTLKVTPQINDGDVVRLKVAQETSNVTDTAQAVQATDVVTNKRSINTTVLVNDGSIVALGGLMEEGVRSSESKVPLLGDIPLLGALFRSTQRSHVKTNLLVLLQPTIIRDDAKAAEIVDRKYQSIRAVNMELDDVGNLKVIGRDIYPENSGDLIRNGLRR